MQRSNHKTGKYLITSQTECKEKVILLESNKNVEQDSILNSLCTWKEDSSCLECDIPEDLLCRWDRKRVLKFYGIYMLFTLPSWYGLIMLRSWGGIGALVLTYLVFSIVYFIFIEMLVLCSHCPYYNRKGKLLYCQSSKHGMPKIWKYKPGPLNKIEKAVTIIGMIVFLGFPTVAISVGLGIVWSGGIVVEVWKLSSILILDVLTVIFGINFVFILKKKVCSKCINFSCPLNTVSKELVDAYLKKNPVMREAWEKAGYQLS